MGVQSKLTVQGQLCCDPSAYLQRGKGPDEVGQVLPAEAASIQAGQPGGDLPGNAHHQRLRMQAQPWVASGSRHGLNGIRFACSDTLPYARQLG